MEEIFIHPNSGKYGALNDGSIAINFDWLDEESNTIKTSPTFAIMPKIAIKLGRYFIVHGIENLIINWLKRKE